MRRDRSTLTRRSLLASGASALLASCAGRRTGAPAAASPPMEAASTSLPRVVPLVYDEHGGLFLDVEVEGRPARLILDTGASVSTLARRFARELGLALRPGDEVEGTAGVVRTETATSSLAIPGLGTRRLDAAIYDFASYDPACVGILGNDVLGERPFRLDYRGRTLQWDAAAPDETIELELDHGIPRITIALAGVRLDVRIDSGAALAPGPDVYVNVTRAQADELGLAGAPAKVFTATGTGGAALELPVHRVRDLRVAGRTFAEAFAIVQPKVGYFARDDAVGFLGNPVLDKLDPWFDYEGRAFAATRRG